MHFSKAYFVLVIKTRTLIMTACLNLLIKTTTNLNIEIPREVIN